MLTGLAFYGFMYAPKARTIISRTPKEKKIRILEEESSNDLQLLSYCWGWIFWEVNPHGFMKLEIYLFYNRYTQ